MLTSSPSSHPAMLARGPRAGGCKPLLPPLAPARLGGADDPPFGEFAGDEGSFVALQVPEARVAQGVGRFPGGQVQPLPEGNHLRRRAEPGLPGVLLAEPLPRLPAGPAQLVGSKPALGSVAAQFLGERVFAV